MINKNEINKNEINEDAFTTKVNYAWLCPPISKKKEDEKLEFWEFLLKYSENAEKINF